MVGEGAALPASMPGPPRRAGAGPAGGGVRGRRCRHRPRPAAAGSRLPRSQLRPRRSRQPGNAPIRPDPPPFPPHHLPMTRSSPGSLAIRCVANPQALAMHAGRPQDRPQHASTTPEQHATTAVRAAHHTTPPTGHAPYRPGSPGPPAPVPPQRGQGGSRAPCHALLPLRWE